MNILVLMPLNERQVYAATGIYKNLPTDVQEKTFPMPMYMQYLISTKRASNWMEAAIFSIACAINFCKQHEEVVILGNLPMDKKSFDRVYNFQDIEQNMPYKDEAINKLIETIGDSDSDEDSKNHLLKYLGNLHVADESEMALHNCRATAGFLGKMSTSDPHLERFKEEEAEVLAQLYSVFGGQVNDDKHLA